MSIGRLGMLVPMDPPGVAVLNGLMFSVVDGVPRVDAFHSKEAARALLEEMTAPETAEAVADHLKLLEHSTLPDISELQTVTFPFWLSANVLPTILAAISASEGLTTMSARISASPHVYRFILPAKPPADVALLALVDAGQATLYLMRSKAQGREVLARHAAILSPESYAVLLGHVESCEYLPETAQDPVEAVLGYAAQLYCVACAVLDTRHAQSN